MAEPNILENPTDFESFGEVDVQVDAPVDDFEVYHEVPLTVFDEKRGSTFQYPAYFDEVDINFANQTEIDGIDKSRFIGMQKVDDGIFSNIGKALVQFAVSTPANIFTAFRAIEEGLTADIIDGLKKGKKGISYRGKLHL